MMKFKLGQVVNYAYSQKKELIPKALKKFFGDDIPGQEKLMCEEINGLFNEWLIFDFKLTNKMSIAVEYFLKNPDSLDQSLLDELEEILKTQFYDFLEIIEVKKREWLKLYSFTKGKVIKIWDKAGSAGVLDKATITGRVAKIRGRWYLVGSNGIQLPLSSTPRHKKFMRQAEGSFKFTPKDTLGLLLKKDDLKQPVQSKIYTKKEIKNKRKKLEKKFNQLAKKYVFQVDFKRIIEFIDYENYKSNHADMYKDFVNLGIPENAVFNSLQLFQDIWNFFPHKSLRGGCPVEKYQEAYLK
ncbi:hypothetical protein KKB83_02730 [Patescibacteria group bacterium]|nr:hypothetical protein [Patescibacteria group bacterium]